MKPPKQIASIGVVPGCEVNPSTKIILLCGHFVVLEHNGGDRIYVHKEADLKRLAEVASTAHAYARKMRRLKAGKL